MEDFFPSIFKVAGHIKECGTTRNTISQLVFDELRFVECFRCVISLIVAFVCLNNNSVCAIKLGISYSSTKSNSSGQSSSTNDSGTSGTYSTSSLSSAQSRSHCGRKFINFHLNAMRYTIHFYSTYAHFVCVLFMLYKIIHRAENRRHHDGCGGSCSGAVPRNPQYASCYKPAHQQKSPQMQPIYNNKRSLNHFTNKARMSDIQNRLPPIKEFRSPTKTSVPSPSRLIASNSRLR